MMTEKVKKANEVIDQMMEVINQFGALDAMKEMDENQFKMVKLMLDMVKVSKEMLTEYGKMMDDQSKKLDKVLEILEQKKIKQISKVD